MASNGEEFLVVWADSRGETRAARVDANGVVRDRESLRLGPGRNAYNVAAASIESDGRGDTAAIPSPSDGSTATSRA